MLIWGEASNLRHMPEALCFLFHGMRLELRGAAAAGSGGGSGSRLSGMRAWPGARAPGWFLSRVVAPLYRSVRVAINLRKGSGDLESHTARINYDDANEFFWDVRACPLLSLSRARAPSRPRLPHCSRARALEPPLPASRGALPPKGAAKV